MLSGNEMNFILINLGLEKTKKIKSALTLQESIKEEIETLKKRLKSQPTTEEALKTNPLFIMKQTLESFVKESENGQE